MAKTITKNLKLTDLKSKPGSRRKRKELGRGRASGHGNTCTRGDNGQGQRSGYTQRGGFEGGQTPMYRRLPKYQTNERANKLTFTIVNLKQLEKLSGEKEITPELLIEKGIIKSINDGIRILGKGDIKFSATIKASHFTEEAKRKIETSGGKCEIISPKKS